MARCVCVWLYGKGINFNSLSVEVLNIGKKQRFNLSELRAMDIVSEGYNMPFWPRDGHGPTGDDGLNRRDTTGEQTGQRAQWLWLFVCVEDALRYGECRMQEGPSRKTNSDESMEIVIAGNCDCAMRQVNLGDRWNQLSTIQIPGLILKWLWINMNDSRRGFPFSTVDSFFSSFIMLIEINFDYFPK